MFRITGDPIDTRACRERISAPAAGGFALFEGCVRDHNDGRAVASLEYEAYAVLAEKEGCRIVEEACGQFDIERAYAEHRTGHLEIGEAAVWVGVSAAHRDAAFAACRYIIDEVKHRVPIWKREQYVDGSTHWVNCARCGKAARRRREAAGT